MEVTLSKFLFTFIVGVAIGAVSGIIMTLVISWAAHDKNKPDTQELELRLQFLSLKVEELRKNQAKLRLDIYDLSKKPEDTGEQPERKDREDT